MGNANPEALRHPPTRIDRRAPSRLALTYTVSGLCLALIFFFIWFAIYYLDPMGDDVLSQFTHGHQPYMDNYTGGVGRRVTDLSTLVEHIKQNYLHITGRVVGAILHPLLSLLGLWFTASATAACVVASVLLAGLLVFGNGKELFRHPVIILALFLILYYSNPAIYYLLMWIFASDYVVSLLLLGAYYYRFRQRAAAGVVFSLDRQTIWFNLFGVLAGMTHEVYSFVMLSLVLCQTSVDIVRRKLPVRQLFSHAGLAAGTLVCVLAPGNFSRLSGSHDAFRMSRPYLARLFDVVMTTKNSLVGVHRVSLGIFVLLMIIVLLKCARSSSGSMNTVLSLLRANAGGLLFLLYFLGVSSLFPYMGSYGALPFVFWLAVLLLRTVYVYDSGPIDQRVSRYETSPLGLLAVLSVLGILCAHEYPWMSSMARTTIERRALVARAIQEHATSVDVPLYEDRYANRFNLFNYNNYKIYEENKTEYYIQYFGVYMNTKH